MDVVGPISNSNIYPSSHTGPLDAPVEIPSPSITTLRFEDQRGGQEAMEERSSLQEAPESALEDRSSLRETPENRRARENALFELERTKQLFQMGRDAIDRGTLSELDPISVLNSLVNNVETFFVNESYEPGFSFLFARTFRLYTELCLLDSKRPNVDPIYHDNRVQVRDAILKIAREEYFFFKYSSVGFQLRCAKEACKRWEDQSGVRKLSYQGLFQVLVAPAFSAAKPNSVEGGPRAASVSYGLEILKAIRGSLKSRWYDHVFAIHVLGRHAASDHRDFVKIHDWIGTIYRERYLGRRVKLLLGIVDTLADAAWNGDQEVQERAINGSGSNPGLVQLASVSSFHHDRNRHLKEVQFQARNHLYAIKVGHDRTATSMQAFRALESLPSRRYYSWVTDELEAYRGSFQNPLDTLAQWTDLTKVTDKQYQRIRAICEVIPNLEPIQVVPVLSHFGKLLSKQGRRDRALKCFKRALKRSRGIPLDHPDGASLMVHRGTALRYLGRVDESFEHFGMALHVTADDGNSNRLNVRACLSRLDIALRIQGELDQTIANSSKVALMNRVLFDSKGPQLFPSQESITCAHTMLERVEATIAASVRHLDREEEGLGEHSAEVGKRLTAFGSSLEKNNILRALIFYKQTLPVFKLIHEDNIGSYADLISKIGTFSRTLGQLENAGYYFNLALEFDQNREDKSAPSIARDWNNLGLTCQARGDIPTALRYYTNALEICNQESGVSEESRASILDNLGNAYSLLGDHDQAIDHHKEALALEEKRLDRPDYKKVAIRWNNLGESYRRHKMPEEAIGCYQRALKIFKELYGPSDPSVATVYNNLALASLDISKIMRAVTHLRAALEIDRDAYGTVHPDIGRDLYNLGRALARSENRDWAIDCYREALAIAQVVYTRNHPHIAQIENSLGIALNASGRREEALGYLEEAWVRSDRIYDREHATTIVYDNNRAAVQTSAESSPSTMRTDAPHKLEIIESLETLGWASFEQKYFKEAAQAYEKAVDLRSKLGLPHIREDYEKMGHALIALGRIDDAKKIYVKQLKSIEDRPFEGPTLESARWHHFLFKVYKGLNNMHDAVQQCRMALDLYPQSGFEQEIQQLETELEEIKRKESDANRSAPSARDALIVLNQHNRSRFPTRRIVL